MLVIAALGAATPALAQLTEISVGLYADQAATMNRLAIATDEPFWLYLVLDRPVSDLPAAVGHPMPLMAYLLRLRCQFEIPANLWVINFDPSLAGQCGPFGQDTNPQIDVCYTFDSMHWPSNNTCWLERCLLRVGLMALDRNPAEIGLAALAGDGSANGLPSLQYYFDSRYGEPCGGVIGLRPLPNGLSSPVFTVNGERVPVAGASWGAVKALYR
jgi:hypothetical protein